MDLFAELGYLALASRLRRLGERLQEEVSAVYAERELGFRARWFPVLVTLSRSGPQPISHLATALGLTHTAIAQIGREMEKDGLVRSQGDPRDGRVRLLALTPAGEALIGRIAPLWEEVRAATAELVEESGQDLLGAIVAVEKRLDACSMTARLRRRLDGGEAELLNRVDSIKEDS